MSDWTFAYYLGLFTGFVFGMFFSPVIYTVVRFWIEFLKKEDEQENFT